MSDKRIVRVGQIVPSSNTTMETEVPLMLSRAEATSSVQFTFHSSRMRMKTVSKEELTKMNTQVARCAQELADARMDVVATACLVAIMCQGRGHHRIAEKEIREATHVDSPDTKVLSSAGALVDSLKAMDAKKVSIITPYVQSLTDLVVDYIEAEGVEVQDAIALEIPDNLAVGRRDPLALVDVVKRLNVSNADALVLSACVQMPSLPALDVVQKTQDIPVVSTAACTAFQMLKTLGLSTSIPNAGDLLSGQY
ncbi:Asp/Glu racemase [Pseudomaricurvus alkylphenolicus]|uniref:maleate cis-trans isomerase family protein n=1 Tax=Pseudomaricurvus alkylphenolicus TaxID=1306991 RepID=UPI0014248145|nr:Asp/Glu racemase [Pseudomaricurvus alkylphenolicus]